MICSCTCQGHFSGFLADCLSVVFQTRESIHGLRCLHSILLHFLLSIDTQLTNTKSARNDSLSRSISFPRSPQVVLSLPFLARERKSVHYWREGQSSVGHRFEYLLFRERESVWQVVDLTKWLWKQGRCWLLS